MDDRPPSGDDESQPSDALRANFGGQELELEFPCPWSYTVIGADEHRMRIAVVGIVGNREHSLTFSHESKGGKYRSLSLELVVESDRDRLRIFAELRTHADIKYVL